MKNSIKERIEKQFKEMCVRKTTFKKVGEVLENLVMEFIVELEMHL